MIGNNFLLWEDETFFVCTPFNPHVPYSDGPIIIVKPKGEYSHSWQDPELTGRAFKLAAETSQIVENLGLCTWFNLQANGNWGLLPDAKPFFHIYIYGRNKTERWAKPIILPEAPKTYKNEPMPEADRILITNALSDRFS